MLIEYMEDYKHIQSLIDMIEESAKEEKDIEEEECIICFYKKPFNEFVIFECSDHHKSCINCYSKLDKCPLCYVDFKTPLNQNNIITVTSIPVVNNRIEIQNENRIRRQINNEIIINLMCKCVCGTVCVIILFVFVYAVSSYVTNHSDK
jgi:hypothetical protein